MSQSKPEAQNKLHGITALVFLCLLALHLPFVFFKPEHPPGSASPSLVLNLSQSAAGEASAPEEPYSPPEPPPREVPEPEPLPAVTEDAVQEPVPAEPAKPAEPQETSAETSAAHSGQEGSSALPSTTPADIGGSASTARGVEDARYRILREIEKNKLYPRAARRRGLEGDVTLAFTVEPDGSATAIRIIQSTANSLLDTAALKAVENTFPMDVELSSPLEMQVTLRFALTS